MNPAERARALRAEIERHDHRYYTLNDPSIPDAEYDRLFRELRAGVASMRWCALALQSEKAPDTYRKGNLALNVRKPVPARGL